MWTCLFAVALAADFDRHELGEFYALDDVSDPVVHQAAESVVDMGTATGWVVSSDGYVLTNAHVADHVGDLVIGRTSLERQLIVMDLIRVHPDLDLALYRLRTDRFRPIPMRDSPPREGESVAVLGHPDDLPLRASFGKILTDRAMVSDVDSIEYSAQTWWGSSGSPVLDEQGRAIATHWGWDSEGRYHGRLLGVPLDRAAKTSEILASIRDCPDPNQLFVDVEPLDSDDAWSTLRLTLRGNEQCLERATDVVWHLHPTFEDPDVPVDAGEGFPLNIRVWGSFPITVTVDLDGRHVEVPGYVRRG